MKTAGGHTWGEYKMLTILSCAQKLSAVGVLMAVATFGSGCIGSDSSPGVGAAIDEVESEPSIGEATEAVDRFEEGSGSPTCVAPTGKNDECDSAGGSCQTASNCSNCVFYARCRKPNLPTGLWTYNDKVNIINTQSAQAGAVAIINTGDTVGHVAYVEAVNGSTITIAEGNWPYGSCGQRSGTKASLKIAGFFM